MKNIVLIGMPGTGKSAVGRSLASRLNCAFVDMDAVLEEKFGQPVSDIFTTAGETAFRAAERDLVATLGSATGQVIATGGGVVMDTASVEALRRQGILVLLTATLDVLLRRVGHGRERPLLKDADDLRNRLQTLLEERRPLYAVADCLVDTTHRSISEVVEHILEAITPLNPTP